MNQKPRITALKTRSRRSKMKKYSSLTLACAILFGGFVSAHADTILVLGSYGTSASNPGVGNSATIYDPLNSTVNSGSTSTAGGWNATGSASLLRVEMRSSRPKV